MKFSPGVRKGHGDLPASAEGVHVPVAEQLLGGLEVARIQVTHEDLRRENSEKLRRCRKSMENQTGMTGSFSEK